MIDSSVFGMLQNVADRDGVNRRRIQRFLRISAVFHGIK